MAANDTPICEAKNVSVSFGDDRYALKDVSLAVNAGEVVAILGPNRIVEQPVVRDGQIVVRKLMNLSSSFDHRVVDGYDAASFIQRLRTLIEAPAMLFIEE